MPLITNVTISLAVHSIKGVVMMSLAVRTMELIHGDFTRAKSSPTRFWLARFFNMSKKFFL